MNILMHYETCAKWLPIRLRNSSGLTHGNPNESHEGLNASGIASRQYRMKSAAIFELLTGTFEAADDMVHNIDAFGPPPCGDPSERSRL